MYICYLFHNNLKPTV